MNKLQLIRACLRAGLSILPLVSRGKKPAVEGGVHSASRNTADVMAYFKGNPRANYGIATGEPSGVFVLDVDGPAGGKSLAGLTREHGELPKTVCVETRRGSHLYFRTDGANVRNSAGKLGKGLDVRGDGGYAVGPGSTHPSGSMYRFKKGRALGEVAIAPAPSWLLALVSSTGPNLDAQAGTAAPPIVKRSKAYAAAALHRELRRLRNAPLHQRNDTLNRCAFSLGQLCGPKLLDASVVASELAKVAREIGLSEEEIAPTITSGMTAGRATPRSSPAVPNRDDSGGASTNSGMAADDLTRELASLGQTDADNAQRFARRFGHKVAYSRGRGWLLYDDARWRRCAHTECIPLAERTARLIAAEAPLVRNANGSAARANFAEQSLSKSSLDRMLELAKSHLLVDDSVFDADPWLLNVRNGTIDLQTGQLFDHDARDFLTRLAPVVADPNAKCPTFKRFIKRALGDDPALISYVQRCIGMTLTGRTTEHVFFFVYGPSRTGKSTLINGVREMLGDYGIHTPTETLLVKQYDNSIPADLARLAGARMVTAIEANWNRQIDEARIKAMTGGEPIVARFMRQDFFKFQPVFKLWFVANDFPKVRGTAGAFWERVRVIPLIAETPEDDRDPHLPEKLEAEWPGILAWAVRGSLRWQKDGLKPPQAVIKATKVWREGSDHVRKFVQQRIIEDEVGETASAALFSAYKDWCIQHGETTLSAKALKAKLQDEYNFQHGRNRRGSRWSGIRLRA